MNANELRHDKTNKLTLRPAKTQISLGIRPVWSESSLSAWRKLGSYLSTERTAKTLIRLGSLIWVFAGRTLFLLGLSWLKRCDLGASLLVLPVLKPTILISHGTASGKNIFLHTRQDFPRYSPVLTNLNPTRGINKPEAHHGRQCSPEWTAIKA